MTERTRKVERVIQQAAAARLIGLLPRRMAPAVTITAAEVSPDLKHAVIWIGVLAEASPAEQVMKELEAVKPELQAAVAQALSTKFVPRLSLRLDQGGAYAAGIEAIIKKL